MSAITANSQPVFSGANEWGLPEWVAWHKALVKKYNTASVLLKKGSYTFAFNSSADSLFNKEYEKTTFFSKVRNNLGNPISYKDERKYIGMWPKLIPSASVQAMSYDPVFTGISIAGDVAEGIADFSVGLVKIVKWTAIIGGTVLIIGVGTYAYNSFKKKTE